MPAWQSASLRNRMLLSATAVLLAFLSLMGIVLDQAFQRSAEEGVGERLLLQIYGLLAVTEQSAVDDLELPEALAEPRFNQLGSGLFGLVLETGGRELWRSPSALDLSLPPAEKARLYQGLGQGVERLGTVNNDSDEKLFYLSYQVTWAGAGPQQRQYVFVALQTMDQFLSEVRGFRNSLWGWLLGVVVVLIVVQWLVMSWGLSPLKQVALDLHDIEEGKGELLQGDYPLEIAGVTRNLNLLLTSERAQREKYRTTLADLAHSLKTPLAILRNAAATVPDAGPGPGQLRETLEAQVDRMNEIVGYQLERAVTKDTSPVRKSIDAGALVQSLLGAINKVYPDTDISLGEMGVGKTGGTPGKTIRVYGDDRDLLEMLGNLLDNACKYGDGIVKVSMRTGAQGIVEFAIENNGQPIPEAEYEAILQRGARLDTAVQGQGIGLAVVSEIAARYGGEVRISQSELGGALVTVTLPIAKA